MRRRAAGGGTRTGGVRCWRRSMLVRAKADCNFGLHNKLYGRKGGLYGPGSTPLHIAVGEGMKDVVQLMVRCPLETAAGSPTEVLWSTCSLLVFLSQSRNLALARSRAHVLSSLLTLSLSCSLSLFLSFSLSLLSLFFLSSLSHSRTNA